MPVELLKRLRVALGRRYAIERELGHGGTAVVYLARDLKHQRAVALKVLRPDLAAAVGPERFLREIRVSAQLSHPHIVPLYDSGQAVGFLYYAMPYVEGESLRSRLGREGQLPIAEAVQITCEVADALRYAHSLGFVHRDIKPENILLSGNHALVADFGIARALDAAGGEKLTETGLAIGTPAYMSPEQAAGSGQIDGRSDLYSLGCVLYEMLGGAPPFTAPSPQAVVARHTLDPVPPLRTVRATVPAALEAAVMKALAKVPADRFATATEFTDAVTHDLQARSPVRHVLRRTVALWAGATAIAALGGALVLQRARTSLDPRRVMVAGFRNQTGDTALDHLGAVAADYVSRGLAETRLVEVVEASAEAPPGRGIAAGGPRDDIVLARAAGAGSIVWGRYYRQGDSLRFEVQVVQTRTGNLLRAVQPVLSPVGRQTAGVEVLRQRVMASFAALFDPRFSAYEAAASEPAVYEAYQEYLAGADAELGTGACRQQACQEVALAHYRRAFALDSNFTLPLAQATTLLWLRGACSSVDSIAAFLGSSRRPLPTLDRASLDWSVASCHGRRSEALEAAREAVLVAPRSDRLAILFAWFARHNGHPREAIAVVDKLSRERHVHDLMYWGDVIISRHVLGDYEEELSAAEQAHRLNPQNLELLAFKLRALAALGRTGEALAGLDEAVNVPINISQPFYAATTMLWTARELRWHGQPQASQAALERAIAWCKARPAPEQPDVAEELSGALYDSGRWAEAKTVFEQLVAADSQNVWYRAMLGAVAAHQGDRRTVDLVDQWLASRKGPYLRGEPTFQRARLAAVLGDRERAMALLRLAFDQGFGFDWGLGTHADPDFESLRDYPPFEELMRPKG